MTGHRLGGLFCFFLGILKYQGFSERPEQQQQQALGRAIRTSNLIYEYGRATALT